MFATRPVDVESLHAAIETLWITTAVGVVSLVVALASLWIARASLKAAEIATQAANDTLQQARDVADRDLANCRQSKWLELHFRAGEMCDPLDYFQKVHLPKTGEYRYSEPINTDYDKFMHLNHRSLAMAVVFPKNSAIDKLVEAAAAFKDWQEVFSKDRLALIEDAVQDLREFALLGSEVLLAPETPEQIKKSLTGQIDKTGSADTPKSEKAH
jgi:hypothetical protein